MSEVRSQKLALGETLSPAVGGQVLPAGLRVGEYIVDGPLGSGAYGDVYAGHHPVIGKAVAIKVLKLRYSAEADVVSRFVAEARAVNTIRHPAIIDIFAFGTLEDGRHYFVMELLEGQTLRALLRERDRLSAQETVDILEPIARALDAAHAQGIAHRDLKPDNIYLATDGAGWRPKLLDFGVAKLREEDRSHATETGATVGTPAYMAPEQCIAKGVDHRADRYALGVVAFEMLAGEQPFVADSTFQMMAAHINEAPDLRKLAGTTPAGVLEVVGALLAKQPGDRPPPGQAMDAMRGALEGAPRGPRRWGRALAVPLLAAGVVAWFALTQPEAPRAPRPGVTPPVVVDAAVVAAPKAPDAAPAAVAEAPDAARVVETPMPKPKPRKKKPGKDALEPW